MRLEDETHPGSEYTAATGNHLAMKPSDSRGGESAHGVAALLSREFLKADWPRLEGTRIVADDPIIPVARNLRF
jgi:hypothetical protein